MTSQQNETLKAIQKTWGAVFNGPESYEQLLRLRELEKMEVHVKDMEKLSELACEVSDTLLRLRHPNINHDVDEGHTIRYTDESQVLFDEIYDEFLNCFNED
jgi:hypothetical protein